MNAIIPQHGMNLMLKYWNHSIILLAKSLQKLQPWPEISGNIAYILLEHAQLLAISSSQIQYIKNSSYVKIILQKIKWWSIWVLLTRSKEGWKGLLHCKRCFPIITKTYKMQNITYTRAQLCWKRHKCIFLCWVSK